MTSDAIQINIEKHHSKIKCIRYLLLDVDGVLTDGKIYLDSKGREMKVFNIYDGLGISLLRKNGIEVGILSGRSSSAVQFRSKELGIKDVHQGISDKLKKFEEIPLQKNLQYSEVAFIGDDLIDLPLLKRVGFSVAVANAVSEVKSHVHLVTQKRGGEGAVREVADLLLMVKEN